MNRLLPVLFFIAAVLLANSAIAVSPGKNVVFDGGKMGKVIFDGKIHSEAGIKCTDCHPKIFPKKKGASKIKPPHKLDKFCGVCHNGEKAPSVHGNCMKCHLQ